MDLQWGSNVGGHTEISPPPHLAKCQTRIFASSNFSQEQESKQGAFFHPYPSNCVCNSWLQGKGFERLQAVTSLSSGLQNAQNAHPPASSLGIP